MRVAISPPSQSSEITPLLSAIGILPAAGLSVAVQPVTTAAALAADAADCCAAVCAASIASFAGPEDELLTGMAISP